MRVALVVFVLAWISGRTSCVRPFRSLIVFLIALGLELNFLIGALRGDERDTARSQAAGRSIATATGTSGETDDLVLVRRDGEEIWVPYSGESAEEMRSSSRSRSLARGCRRAGVRARAPSVLAPVRRFLVGLGIIGALGLAIWFVESRTGWDALDGSTRIEAMERFSDEASRIAEKPVDDLLRRIGRLRRSRAARRRGRRGRRRARIPDARALPRPVPACFRGRGAGEPDGARDRGPRARGVASPRRAATRGRPSATRCSRASRWAAGSGSRRRQRAS